MISSNIYATSFLLTFFFFFLGGVGGGGLNTCLFIESMNYLHMYIFNPPYHPLMGFLECLMGRKYNSLTKGSKLGHYFRV